MREYVATAKTVEEAIQLGCEALSVDRDDLGVSYEILEMPQKTGFLGLKVTRPGRRSGRTTRGRGCCPGGSRDTAGYCR